MHEHLRIQKKQTIFAPIKQGNSPPK